MATRDTNIGFEYKNPPEAITASHSIDFEENLPIISGQYLLPLSYLPNFITTEVRGAVVSVDKEEHYCGIDYLSQFWPESLVSAASKVCYCESRGNPEIVNDTPGVEYSVGNWQINLLSHKEYTEEEMKDPLLNLKAALKIFYYPQNGGWGNWLNCARYTGVLP